MASSITEYTHLWKLIATGGLDLDTSQIDVRLVTSGYTFDAAHTQWDNGANDSTDPSFNETTGTGYTAGGKTLTSPVVTATTIGYADLTWTSLTATFRQAIAVGVGTFGGVTNPVLFRILLDTTPADIVITSSTYEIIWNSVDKLFYKP